MSVIELGLDKNIDRLLQSSELSVQVCSKAVVYTSPRSKDKRRSRGLIRNAGNRYDSLPR